MEIKMSQHFHYKTLLRFTLPSVVMMIVNSIYSIVDGFFVSNFAGKMPFAAVNLVMPVLMALSAIGFMIGTGGSALVAKTLGEGKDQKANEIFSMLIYVLTGTGTVIALAGFLFMPPLSRLLGADDTLLADCILYGRILMAALPFFMLQNSFQSFLIAAEHPKMGLYISLASGILNMFLDYWFVYLLRAGIGGAAVATAISQFLGCLILFCFFIRPKKGKLRLVKLKWDGSSLLKACGNGSSEMLTNLSASLVGILYNFRLMEIAAEDGVAAYGVIMYVNFIFLAFFFGYAIACGPVVGYHYGAGNKEELKSLLRKSLVITTVVALLMFFLAEVLALPMAKIFVGYDSALCDMTTTGMQLYSLSFLLCGFNIYGSAYFTGLNDGASSALISFLRTLFFQVLAIILLPMFLDINGIWLAITFAEAATLLVTVALLLKKRKRYGY